MYFASLFTYSGIVSNRVSGVSRMLRKRQPSGNADFFRALALFAFMSSVSAGASATMQLAAASLAEMSLEELSNLEVTSVSKHAERLSDAAASVFVITGDDIRRSGASSLPEALSLAPNLLVAQVGASSYAISARGFNSTAANKLLVLIDGRAVYTPLYSGVFWDAQDVMLEDVDRIEVISGPGATLWGANAVNGVVNVITKPAAATQGNIATFEAGNLGRTYAVRHGGRLQDAEGDAGSYRVYGRFFDRFNTDLSGGATASDGWSKSQAGFRADWGSVANEFGVQGDAYRGSEDQPGAINAHLSGANLVGHWGYGLADGARIQWQAYIDNTEREVPGSFSERLNTYDIELLHSLSPMGMHSVSWGGGYRAAGDHVISNPLFAFLPNDLVLRWANLFAQDEMALSGDRLRLTLGGKLEHNPYSGYDFLPSARLAWKIEPNRLLWTAVSRAARAPSRIDRDLFAPPTSPFFLAGGPDFTSEISRVVEVGYRAEPSPRFSYSMSLYRSFNEHLRSVETVAPGQFVLGNKMKGTSTGFETWGSFQAAQNWRLSAGAIFIHQRLSFTADSTDTNTSAAGDDPAHQWLLRSSLDLSGGAEFDVDLRRVGALPNPVVPAYTALNLRYGWQPWRDVEFAVIGQNLLDHSHPEFGTLATRSEIDRSLSFKATWTF